jgi:hypothetical protein
MSDYQKEINPAGILRRMKTQGASGEEKKTVTHSKIKRNR